MKTIKSVEELNKQFKQSDLKKQIAEIKKIYIETLEYIIEKNNKYGIKKSTIIDDYILFNTELDKMYSTEYILYYGKSYTFEDFILFILSFNFENINIKINKFTLKTFNKMIESLKNEKHSVYFIKTILLDPLNLIKIDFSPIHFNQAYEILKQTNTLKHISNKLLIEKWAIYTLQDNNGSFFKIKSNADSKYVYKYYDSRPFKQGWEYCLNKFCEDKSLKKYYNTFLKILNSLLIPHTKFKGLYGIIEYVEIEKQIGNDILDLYYHEDDNDDHINDDDGHIDDDECKCNKCKFNKFILNFERDEQIKFTDEQIQAIKSGITDDLCIITGPPGTGKSTIIKAIIEWYNINTTNNCISIQAPTGKAFKGIIEKCQNVKDFKICGTLHKCLLNSFNKNKMNNTNNNIDNIVIDEVSMVDIFMFKKLITWCKYYGCRLILCGDCNQLPPVGKGRPFESLINSGLFNIQFLTEIKRQNSGKLKDCIVNINNNTLSENDFDNINTIFINHDFKDDTKTIQIFNTIVAQDGIANIGIITPENNKEPGVFEMNKLLQNHVYNKDKSYYHGYFKEGDKVMRTENNYSDDIIRVNGDCGEITFTDHNNNSYVINDYNKKHKIKKVPASKIEYECNNSELVKLSDLKHKFMLNYCNTVHKFQGSQMPVIVFICSPLHASLSYGTNRLKLAYTAISRAQRKLIVIGDKTVFFNIQNCKDEPFITSFMIEFNDFEFE